MTGELILSLNNIDTLKAQQNPQKHPISYHSFFLSGPADMSTYMIQFLNSRFHLLSKVFSDVSAWGWLFKFYI